VAGRNGTRRSVSLELLDGGRRVGIGNVSIPANQAVPPEDSIVEFCFL